MVKLTRIYTRGGDKGQTSLSNGARVPKHAIRVSSYGTVDEANAIIGLARLHTKELPEIDALLSRIQNDLFDLGADLANPIPGPDDPPPKWEALRINDTQVTRLENEIDAYNEKLQPLNSFILPGGSPAAAHLHHARTVTRRAEREAYAVAAEETVNGAALRYLNRLSDLLFVLSRHLNDDGATDVLWVPGANR